LFLCVGSIAGVEVQRLLSFGLVWQVGLDPEDYDHGGLMGLGMGLGNHEDNQQDPMAMDAFSSSN
jgi:hypothetical protein